MSEEVLINVGPGETRVAIIEDERPVEFILERTLEESSKIRTGRSGHSLLGNIFLGHVQKVLSGMQAAFVDIGLERSGFLGVREARCLCDLPGYNPEHFPLIKNCVQEGQSVLVQVVKDPIGEKGARLSANVTLPGRLLVMIPNQSGIALSRRIVKEEERERLLALVTGVADQLQACGLKGDPAGFIVRSAALDASGSEILEDAGRLAEEWKNMRAACLQITPPSVVFHDLDPVSRALRDYARLETSRVLIDDGTALCEARDYCRHTMPEMIDRLVLHQGPSPLFSLYNTEEELDAALDSRVTLPSGGWVTFEMTEALTAVDVNSGKYTTATGLEETSIKINLEAVDAIVHQLRLRGIGGLVVIDFIHMAQEGNKEKVLEKLNAGFRKDRTPTRISQMSEFGLVEMTRKRTREPLDQILTESTCWKGRPRIKTCATMANEAMRRAICEARGGPGKPLEIHVAEDVAEWLQCHGAHLITGLQHKIPGGVTLIGERRFDRERIEVVVAQ